MFGQDAERFDRARPTYPAELIDDVLALVGMPCRAVDAGCGTGKATVLLAARGVEGVGVEPDTAMATVARERLSTHRGWRVDVSDFEDWTPAPGEAPFDLVTCAQAWHWIDDERGTRQAARLLRGGGWLAIFGRRPDARDTALGREIDAEYAERVPEVHARSGAPLEPVLPGTDFDEPLVRRYHGWQDYSTEAWIELLRTSSDHIILAPDRREALLEAVAAVIDRHGGTYRHHYVAELWAARRR